MKKRLAVFLILTSTTFSQDIPFLSGRVNDYAGMLSSSVIRRIETLTKQFEDTTGNQIAILTVDNLQGYPLEDFSIKVVENWKLGRKGVDNGALLLVAKEERKVRIEVGYGLEGVLTDAITSQIIRRLVVPAFKKGDFDGGVEEGVTAMINAIGGEYKIEPESTESADEIFASIMTIIFWVIIVISFIVRRNRFFRGGAWSSRRGIFLGGGPWIGGGFGGGGFGGGGGFSGGGGSFGGGGSSGSW